MAPTRKPPVLSLVRSTPTTSAPVGIVLDPPRDCVRCYPAISPDSIDVVAYDATGTPRIRLEMPVADLDVDVETWLLDRVRRTYGRAGPLFLS